MDVMRTALSLLGVSPAERGDDVKPYLVFRGRCVEPGNKNTIADVEVDVAPNKDTADRLARQWCAGSGLYTSIAWTVSAEYARSQWHYMSDRYGSADVWAQWGKEVRALPGESYVDTVFRANDPSEGASERVLRSFANDFLTLDKAVAAADVLSMTAPHLGKIMPADLTESDPPRGMDVWRLPPGEAPWGKPMVAQDESELTRVREIMRASKYDTMARPGAGVTIAVLDTGVDARHPAFKGTPLRAIDATGEGGEASDSVGHGTWCAGAIGGFAVDTANSPYMGLAVGCSILAIKVLTSRGWGTDAMIARGIEIAISAKVDGISMSLGGAGEMPRTRAAIELAKSAGIPITAAAGNEGPAEGTVGYPGAYNSVECVGALTQAEPPTIARFSSRGSEVDVCAPGDLVYGPWANGRWTKVSGTSMATPLVAAARALCRTERLKFPPADRCPIEVADQMVYATVYNLAGWSDRPTAYGQGCVNITEALAAVRKACQPKEPPPPPVDPEPGNEFKQWFSPLTEARNVMNGVRLVVGEIEGWLNEGHRVEVSVKPLPENS